MCLGVPGKVVDIYQEGGLLMGKVDFGGVLKRICLDHVPEIRPGEYALVHVGFAIARIDEAEAGRVFAFLESMNELDDIRRSPDADAGPDPVPPAASPPVPLPESRSAAGGGGAR